jgi:hypothetical protein
MEMTHEDLRLVEDLHALQVHERHLVHEFVKLLFRSQESAKDNMQALK